MYPSMLFVSASTDYPPIVPPTSSPSVDEIYVQNLPQNFKDILEECTKKMTVDCSEEIVTNMINSKTPVSDNCCKKLVDMGLKCHKALVRLFVGLPEAKGYASQIYGNGAIVYNNCALLANKASPAPF